MTLLFRVLYAYQCKGTHHKLAMDALRHLKHADADLWEDLFLAQIEDYLKGSKDPDQVFKDFRNHVLHVSDNYWGGAVQAGRLWYERAVSAFQKEDWKKGVYAAGVLTHYITDVLMPLHTGQTEKEGTIHRACEWSVSISYDLLNPTDLPERASQTVSTNDADWLEQLIVHGAELAHVEYDKVIQQYDFTAGVKDPPEGLNEELQITFRRLLRQAALNVAFTLDHLFEQANVTPPKQNVTLKTVLATSTIPVFWITKKLQDRQDRKLVEAIYQELQETGAVEKHLPEDDRSVRELYECEVLKKPVVRETLSGRSVNNSVHQRNEESQQGRKFYLHDGDDVVDAPSIGAKTARRLNRIGITTVSDLLAADAEDSVRALDLRYITAEIFNDWQSQAFVMKSVPTLRVHDAQILVGCNITTAESLAIQQPSVLLNLAQVYVESADSKRYLREALPPDLKEVSGWIAAAKSVVDGKQVA